jgi:ribosomal protein L18E
MNKEEKEILDRMFSEDATSAYQYMEALVKQTGKDVSDYLQIAETFESIYEPEKANIAKVEAKKAEILHKDYSKALAEKITEKAKEGKVVIVSSVLATLNLV